MKNKKLLSLILALAMTFSLAVPAFATTPTVDNTELTDMAKINTATTTVNGTYQAPVLALTVPKKINLLLNPYGRAVTTNKDTALEQEDVQGQIISADNLIISRSNVPIGIKATATGTIASGSGEGSAWTLAKTPIVTSGTGASTKKEALVYMIFGDVDTSEITDSTAVDKFMENTYVAGSGSTAAKIPYEGITIDDIDYAEPDATLSNITFTDATTAKDGIIIQSGEGKETLITKTLSECSVSEGVDAQGAPTYTYNNVSAVAFKMDGVMVGNPKDSSWGKDDKLTVSVAWKFVPDTQAVPMRVNEYIKTDGAISVDLAHLLDDENTTSPAFALKGNSDATITLSTVGALAITNAGLAAKKGSALAVGDKLTYKLKATYMNKDTTPVEVTKSIILTVRFVDDVATPSTAYSVASPANLSFATLFSVDDEAALFRAPTGVTVAAAGTMTVTKEAVVAANGGKALVQGDVVYIGPFGYAGKASSTAVPQKTVVIKVVAAA